MGDVSGIYTFINFKFIIFKFRDLLDVQIQIKFIISNLMNQLNNFLIYNNIFK